MVESKVYQEEINGMLEWIQHEYDREFASYFKDVRDMFKRLQSEEKPITDKELNWILINLPMTLFDVSEKLSQTDVSAEIIKLRIKEQEAEFIKQSTEKTATAKKAEAESKLAEPKMMLAVYQALINRVENEMTFAKELIMGAKKIWDSRRKTEQSNPVAPVNETHTFIGNVPEYKTPIFGTEV